MHAIASGLVGATFLLRFLGMADLPAATEAVEQLTVMPRVVEESGSTAMPLGLPQEFGVPRIVPEGFPVFQPPTRINRYEVWQLYEVGRYGQFRPRVIYAPYGAFYLYDGRPYPWTSLHPQDFLPRAIVP